MARSLIEICSKSSRRVVVVASCGAGRGERRGKKCPDRAHAKRPWHNATTTQRAVGTFLSLLAPVPEIFRFRGWSSVSALVRGRTEQQRASSEADHYLGAKHLWEESGGYGRRDGGDWSASGFEPADGEERADGQKVRHAKRSRVCGPPGCVTATTWWTWVERQEDPGIQVRRIGSPARLARLQHISNSPAFCVIMVSTSAVLSSLVGGEREAQAILLFTWIQRGDRLLGDKAAGLFWGGNRRKARICHSSCCRKKREALAIGQRGRVGVRACSVQRRRFAPKQCRRT
ncbi:hypothetical protein K490DRAFT_55697 [Saccharata proteae CBS 121410]|uniref:Uncharacterized protein n=1 Tax=Saccharata proteae CBS 121410 TaxID=1314787 RepID=A0A6A5YC68_9PEZI|nr:hypothetical protein K490DRAFT_55697 [Saccharata proteae CBS 121410]